MRYCRAHHAKPKETLMRPVSTFVPSSRRPSRGVSSSNTPQSQWGPERHDKYRVLLVSGNLAERKQWQNLLTEGDFLCSVADNGKEALRFIQFGDLDLVIAAVMMPEMDGIELVRLAGTIADAPPIIVVARGRGTPDHAFLKSAALAGATATYTQPLRVEDFVAGIRTALALKRAPWTKPQD
jgi:CheY-like chemotaxis protein